MWPMSIVVWGILDDEFVYKNKNVKYSTVCKSSTTPYSKYLTLHMILKLKAQNDK